MSDKDCPPGKIRNPASGRCVLVTGKIGKQVLAASRKPLPQPHPTRPTPTRTTPARTTPTHARCPAGKIVNPATGRCVLVSGAIGRKVLSQMQVTQPQRPPQPRPRPQRPAPAPPQRPRANNNEEEVRGLTPYMMVQVRGQEVKVKKAIKKCEHVFTFLQQGPICWFTAVMTALFSSQYLRLAIAKALPGLAKVPWKAPIALDMAKILAGYDRRNAAPELFDRLEPHRFLEYLGSHNPNVFNAKLSASGGYSELYLKKMLDFLETSHLFVARHKSEDTAFVLSTFNYMFPQNTDKRLRKLSRGLLNAGKHMKLKAPAVLVVLTEHIRERLTREAFEVYERALDATPIGIKGAMPNAHAPTIQYEGWTYYLDSFILANNNTLVCQKSHAIAGVTCNGQRYMYNGWASSTRGNKAMGGVRVNRALPCPLMPVDWTKAQNLVIDTRGCRMAPAPPGPLFDDMRFNTVQNSIAMYIRSDMATGKAPNVDRTITMLTSPAASPRPAAPRKPWWAFWA